MISSISNGILEITTPVNWQNIFGMNFILTGIVNKNAEFSLLIPKGMDFHYQAQNLNIEPKPTTTPDGQLFEWKMQNRGLLSVL